MANFWDYNVWGTFSVFAVLLSSLLLGSVLKKSLPLLRGSLIPTSVIGGAILIIFSTVYKGVTGEILFDTEFFGGNGTEKLEIITYHALALGFIASTLKSNKNRLTRRRTNEIFNTGCTTVATYVLQGIVGLAVTMIAALIITDFFPAAGALLPFGYGQGTGQALNYGTIYELEYGFDGGKSFGLTIAALGFLSASIGGVLYLNIMKHRGKLKLADPSEMEPREEITVVDFSESLDRMTVQISLIATVYFITFGVMYALGSLLPGMRSIIYGFNFLIGVLIAMLVKWILNFLRKKDVLHKEYTDNFLLTRTSNICFDIMIVSGIAAIRLDILQQSWGILLILGVAGAICTYAYNRFIAKKLFPHYAEEQFMMMYGMLTGTASTGTILLREIDGEFKTPASDNMIYQNLPAIVFGFPMMIVATMAPKQTTLTLIVLVFYFLVLNMMIFRQWIFRKRRGSRKKKSGKAPRQPME